MSECVITTEQLAVKDREIMLLRAVLHYYADADNYEKQLHPDDPKVLAIPVLLDRGLRAKKAMDAT